MNIMNIAMKKFCRYIVFIALLAFSATESIAQISIEYVTVEGTASTQSQAINNALVEATFRIYGVRIAADTNASIFSSRSNDTVLFAAKIHRVMSRQTILNKRNELLGYDVVSSRRNADGLYEVTVQTKYSEYRVPGPANKRRSLAVLNFPVARGGYLSGKASGISDVLTSRIEALLTQSRQFSVLDRDRDDIYALEKQLLQSGDANTAERARLGKVVGADYIVYGKILPVSVEKIDKSIAISGEYKVQIVATVPVEFRVIAVATRQIKWSSTAVAKRVIDSTTQYQDVDVNQIVGSALGEVAELIFEELTENIYPPKISKVLANNRFILNRGGTTVENGTLFEVFDLGEDIVDPYTGESLGRLESLVGLAKIVEKKPKYSIAKLETSVLIKAGMILRKYRGEYPIVKQKGTAKPSYEDADSDGLPDYLELLNSNNRN